MPDYYLVSGAEDIVPTDQVLRRSGRRVKYGSEVSRGAVHELRSDGRYVVVAHGADDGTVFWTGGDHEERWLWVGMDPMPVRSRVYLYCCNAGPKLTRYLGRRCESFGHSAPVPAPVDEAKPIVLAFLAEVDRLMDGDDFSPESWREHLQGFAAEQFDYETEQPSSLLGRAHWISIIRSLS